MTQYPHPRARGVDSEPRTETLADIAAQTFSGRMVRSIGPKGRSFIECFSLLIDPSIDPWSPVTALGPEFQLLEDREFSGQPKVRPQVLYERHIPSDLEATRFVEGYFAGNHVQHGDGSEITRSLGRVVTAEPMDEKGFWQAIDALARDVTAKPLRRLIDHLAGLSEDEIAGFHARLASVLFELDRPENAIRIKVAGHDLVNDDASLYYRCWIVAQGEQAYRDHLRNPGTRLPSLRWQNAERLLDAAQKAIEFHRTDVRVDVPRATPLVTGSNTAHWGETRSRPRAQNGLRYALHPYQPGIYEAAKWRGVDNPHLDAFYRAELSTGRWYGCRTLTHVPNGFIESIVHFTTKGPEDPDNLFAYFIQNHAQNLGGILIATDPIRLTHTDCYDHTLVYTVHHPARLDLDTYVNRYYRAQILA